MHDTVSAITCFLQFFGCPFFQFVFTELVCSKTTNAHFGIVRTPTKSFARHLFNTKEYSKLLKNSPHDCSGLMEKKRKQRT